MVLKKMVFAVALLVGIANGTAQPLAKTDVFVVEQVGDKLQWQFSSGGTAQWQDLNWTKTATLDRLRFGDFDGDGRTDVFTVERIGDRLQWRYSVAGESQWRNLNWTTTATVDQLRFGDFDGDGKTDVFAVERIGDRLQWQYSAAGESQWRDLNWTRTATVGQLRFGDFDGDGKTDVFTVEKIGDKLQWRFSSGGMSQWKNLNWTKTATIEDLDFGDFDGDGKTDVFTVERIGDKLQWRFSSGGVSQWKNLNWTKTATLDQLRFGDFDGDGRTDVFTVEKIGDKLQWRFSPGGVSQWKNLNSTTTVTIDQLRFGDFDGSQPQIVWDFENGSLENWALVNVPNAPTPNAFKSQPTYGNNIRTSRATQNNSEFVSSINRIGGDYWDGPFPIGIHGNYWIGTYENRPNENDMWGNVQGDSPQGELVSPAFVAGRRYIHFLIGGACEPSAAGIKLQRRLNASSDWTDVPGTSVSGECDENLERRYFDLARLGLRNQELRLVIYDHSSGSWGHINIDHIVVSNVLNSDQIHGPKPVWGFADLHAHLAAEKAFDGLLFYGKTSDVTADNEVHNPFPCGGAVHNTTDHGVSTSKLLHTLEDQLLFRAKPQKNLSVEPHTPRGYQNSAWHTLTHQVMYEKWIKRAYDGGLRLLAAEAVNSRVLAWGLSGGHPDDGPGKDSNSYKEQIRLIKDIARRNNSWMEIALSPDHARRIIRNNKLAVIIGMEVDSFGDCDRLALPTNDGNYYHAGTTPCTESDVRAAVEEAYALGVRQIHPIHLTDNGFGGAAVYNDGFNTSNHYLNNAFFNVADGTPSGISWKLSETQNVVAKEEFMGAPISKSLKEVPVNFPFRSHMNARGLTPNGRVMIREMKRSGMIIAVDHMSQHSLDEVIGDSPADETYPVALTHSIARDLQFDDAPQMGKHKSEIGKLQRQFRRINLIGGVVAPGVGNGDVQTGRGVSDIENNCAGSSRTFAQVYNYYLAQRPSGLHGVHYGVPIGTDANGLNGGVIPRFGKYGCFSENLHIDPGVGKFSVLQQSPSNDFEQRAIQLNTAMGINYDFYGGGSYVNHWTSLTMKWDDLERKRMKVQASHPVLKAAKKDESLNDWQNNWDFNFDGLAHYGMLPDFFQDLRVIGYTQEDLGPLFQGAEAYIRMWEKADALRHRFDYAQEPGTEPILPDPIVRITELDFEPINGSSYNVECTGNHLFYSDVKLFRPIIKLDRPAPVGFSLRFYIQEDGTLSDPTIGIFEARFEAGETTYSSITTPNDKATVESWLGMAINRTPGGAPAAETRGFWLGSTKLCVLRGNGPQGNAGPQNVYLSLSTFLDPDGPMVIAGLNKSPDHEVKTIPLPHLERVVEIVDMDFKPLYPNPPELQRLDYAVKCYGRDLLYSDVKLFKPIIRLAAPAPVGFSLRFWIQEEGSLSDPTIGIFEARFAAGATEVTSISTPNVKSTVESWMNMQINRMPTALLLMKPKGFGLELQKDAS